MRVDKDVLGMYAIGSKVMQECNNGHFAHAVALT